MKRLPLYPFLFIFYIVLTPLADNIDQLDPSLALRPMALLLLVGVVLLVFFYAIFRDWQYAGYLLFLISVFFFAFGYLSRFLQNQLSLFDKTLNEQAFLGISAGVLLLLGIKAVWARLGGHTWLTPYLNLVMALGLLFPVYKLVAGFVREPLPPRGTARIVQASGGELVLDCSNTPDIYYIILDGYGRADALIDLYGFDNRPFLETLERKGFFVADESHTNYTQTIFSIPSSLNFSLIEPPGAGVSGQRYFSDLMRDNKIMSTLKGCGYRTVAIESGYYFTDHPVVDLYLRPVIGLNEFESLLLADSPLDVMAEELNLEPPEHSYAGHRRRVLYSFEKLESLPRMDGPKIVFAHIISPHPPFVFDSSGQPIRPDYAYYIGDGDDFQGSLDEYLAGYPEQAEFVNQQLGRVIDALLANSSTPPVIILQGDHGPGSRLVWGAPDRTCLWERTPILNAYYLPGDGARWLYPSISPVNSFRVVLNAYFDARLPFLPDNTYFTSHRLERQAINITKERDSLANCGMP